MKGIGRALFGTDEQRSDFVDQQTLLSAVQRNITCPGTGRILDVGTSVLFRFTSESGECAAWGVVHYLAWERIAEQTRRHADRCGYVLEVIDGRKWTKGGERRKRPYLGWKPEAQ